MLAEFSIQNNNIYKYIYILTQEAKLHSCVLGKYFAAIELNEPKKRNEIQGEFLQRISGNF